MPELAKVFSTEQGYLPPATGPYVVYDLAWQYQWVALQYVGATEEGMESVAEVQQGNMRVVLVTDECMADPDLLDDVAHRLASHLDCELPKRDDKWLDLSSQLRGLVPPPAFDHMRLTMADVNSHIRD